MSEEIEIDVRLKLDKSEIDQAGNSNSGEASPTTKKVISEISGDKKKLGELLGVDSTKVNEMTGFFKNPTGFLSNKISAGLGGIGKFGVGAGIAGIILSVILPIIMKQVKKVLFEPGGIFDKRLKVITAEAQNAFFTREQQRDKQLGKRQIIFTNVKGFQNAQGILTGNSLEIVGRTGSAGPDIGKTLSAGHANRKIVENFQDLIFGPQREFSRILSKAIGLN